MRIHALRYGIATGEKQKAEIVSSCASLFDMENSKDIFIFNQWLVRLMILNLFLNIYPHLRQKWMKIFLS